MHAALISILLVTAAPHAPMGGYQHTATIMEGGTIVDEACGCAGSGCAECTGCTQTAGCTGAVPSCDAYPDVPRTHWAAWWGPMPQTCYAPRFGCYPGNNRHMNRYPAFHGSYYRRPYNYRHLFDYPWHAMPNEPQGFAAMGGEMPIETDRRAYPTPAPEIVPTPPLQPIPAYP